MWNRVLSERPSYKSRHSPDGGTGKDNEVGWTIEEIPETKFYETTHWRSNHRFLF
jgi:hypothetical protein